MPKFEPYRIAVVNRQRSYRVNTNRLAEVARFVLRAEASVPADVTIAVVDDREMARLNAEYLDHEGPTDVLSFDLANDEVEALELDLIVSADTARRRAEELGHPMLAELALYVTHGLLHQLGYDDHTPGERTEMHARQAELMAEMGFKLGG